MHSRDTKNLDTLNKFLLKGKVWVLNRNQEWNVTTWLAKMWYVGGVSVYHVGGSVSIPGQSNTQGLEIIKEKVLLLL